MLYVPVNSYDHVGTVSSPSHTFFLGKLDEAVNQYFVHIQTATLLESEEGRMAIEIISWSISMKVCHRAKMELVTPGSAVRHVTDCTTWPWAQYLISIQWTIQWIIQWWHISIKYWFIVWIKSIVDPYQLASSEADLDIHPLQEDIK